MPDPTPDLPTIQRFVPKELIDFIRDRIKAGVSDAEEKYSLNAEEEDGLTGALGQAISTPRPLIYQSPQGVYQYDIRSFKIRGRGPGAPEKRLGADAVFQIAVSSGGRTVFTKGLPFQAKKGGGFQNQEVQSQARALRKYFETGIVVRYSNQEYKGVDVRELVADDGFTPLRNPAPKKLGTVLGDDFLNCTVGLEGLYYPEGTEDQLLEDALVINTMIKQLKAG